MPKKTNNNKNSESDSESPKDEIPIKKESKINKKGQSKVSKEKKNVVHHESAAEHSIAQGMVISQIEKIDIVKELTLSNNQGRVCFQCKKHSATGTPVQWNSSDKKSFDVWLCTRGLCKIGFFRGDGWHSSGNHTFYGCHQCDNIMFESDYMNNYPCLCCKLRPKSIYEKKETEEDGFKRILKNNKKVEWFESGKFDYIKKITV
jgi:hypothetical protein